MKLRLWVKVVLVVLCIWLVVAIWGLLTDYENKVRQSCVEGGHSYEWCVRELNK